MAKKYKNNKYFNIYLIGGPVSTNYDPSLVERAREKVKIAREAVGLPNAFLDDWNRLRLDTGRFDDLLGNGLIDILKSNRDSAPIYPDQIPYGFNSYLRATPLIKSKTMTDEEAEIKRVRNAVDYGRRLKQKVINAENSGAQTVVLGEYNPKAHTIYHDPKSGESNLLHELAHASKATPQENKISEIFGTKNTFGTDYYDRPTEIYSRLMLFRQANNLDPTEIITKERLKGLKKSAIDFNLLNRYKDDLLLQLFNDVAYIDTPLNNDVNFAAYGGKINKFDLGGPVGGIVPKGYGQPNFNLTSKINPSKVGIPSGGSGGGSLFMSNLKSGITDMLGNGAFMNSVGNVALGFLNPNGNSTGVGNAMQSIGGLASNIPGVGGLVGAGLGFAGGLVNAAFGSKINEENVALFRALNKLQANYTSNASTNEELLADFGSMLHLGNVARKDVGSDGWFSNKAKKLTRKINAERLLANKQALFSLGNTALTVDTTNDLLKEYNYVAYGGPIDMKYTGTMSPFGNLFKDGGIYIKPENRGKFTALKERTGKSATWFKEHGTPAQKKMATFALNVRKWKHEIGGPLDNSIKLDNTKVYTPVHFEPIERTFIDGRKYSELTPEEQLNVSLGRDISGRPLELGLEIVSPEFDVLSLYRSLATLPKGFLKGTGKVPILPDRYYRQVGRETKGIEDAMSIGKITAKSKAKTITVTTKDGRTFEFGGKDFEVPFFKKGGLWYGDRPGMDVIVGKEAPQLEWMPITQHGRFRPNLIGKEEFYNRVTPLVDGEANLAPSNLFEFYRHYPVIGMRNVTGGFPHFPVTGLNTVSEVVDTNKKAFGGELTHGGVFSNGTSIIGNGGTHEENPYQGIQVGVDELGIPNLVELDEVIWNDYVFSNRLKVPKAVKLKYKLRGNKELSFADAAKNILKESEERPNDPISLNGLDAGLSRLAMEQELIRMKKELRLNKYAEGGELGNLYKGTGSKSNFLLFKKKSYPNIFTTPDFSLYAIKDPFKTPEPRYTTPDFSVSLLKPNASSLKGYMSDMFEPISKDIFNTKVTETEESSNDTRKFKESPLRYAPIVGHAAGVISDIFSKPDYLAADEVRNIELNPSLVGFTPIGNKLKFTPYDINFQINKANANAGASRRNIMNTSGGNRAAAMAGLMGVDYNYTNALGDAYRQALEYNDKRREAVETFNRATDLYNSKMGLKEAMANAESRNAMAKARYERDKIAALLSQLARDAYNTRRSNNLNILLEDLGNLGRERNNRNWLDILADKGIIKMNTKGEHVSSDKKKNGGKLNRKKKGGFTYA